MSLRAGLTITVLTAAAVGVPAPADAQGLESALLQCGTLSFAPATERCAESAVAARALMAQSGLAFGFGSEIAGSSSTLGKRIGSAPRIAASLRAGGLQGRLPDVRSRSSGAAPEADYFLPVLHATLAAGLFEGFKLAPTVGGFLSVDVMAGANLAFFPSGEGFAGSVTAFSAAARIGLVRETFTWPGITLSVARRLGQNVRFGEIAAGGPSIDVDPAVTSLRLTLGKDLNSIGILGGLGWDDYSADAVLGLVDDAGLPAGMVETSVGAGRMIAFGGTSFTLLVLQFSAEVGWAEGLSSVPGYVGAPFDPTKGSFFGGLAMRLTI